MDDSNEDQYTDELSQNYFHLHTIVRNMNSQLFFHVLFVIVACPSLRVSVHPALAIY